MYETKQERRFAAEQAEQSPAYTTPGSLGVSTVSATIPREPEVSMQLEYLRKAVSEVQAAALRLIERLGPVQRPSNAVEKDGPPVPVPVSCPLSNAIRDETSQLQALALTLLQNADRLEV